MLWRHAAPNALLPALTVLAIAFGLLIGGLTGGNHAMAHQRFRRFNTAMFYKEQTVADAMCMAVRAGNHIFLRGQTGFTLEGGFTGLGDAAAQADQAMQNVKILLEEAGAAMADIRKITTYITDRAWREPVYAVIGRHLGDSAPVATGLIVNGLATPEMLVEIDIDAVVAA